MGWSLVMFVVALSRVNMLEEIGALHHSPFSAHFLRRSLAGHRIAAKSGGTQCPAFTT